jgi:hypothetical protein
VSTARQAAGLLYGRHAAGLSVLTTEQIEITVDTAQIPVGVDGEAIVMPVPVTCTVSPGALRVWVPRDPPGVPAPKAPVNWARLRHLAGTGVCGPPVAQEDIPQLHAGQPDRPPPRRDASHVPPCLTHSRARRPRRASAQPGRAKRTFPPGCLIISMEPLAARLGGDGADRPLARDMAKVTAPSF